MSYHYYPSLNTLLLVLSILDYWSIFVFYRVHTTPWHYHTSSMYMYVYAAGILECSQYILPPFNMNCSSKWDILFAAYCTLLCSGSSKSTGCAVFVLYGIT